MSRPSDRNCLAWAILFRSKNSIDGVREYLGGTPDHPCRTRLFESRREARAYLNERYGYIKMRPDLRREPHGWRVPKVVSVTIRISLTGTGKNKKRTWGASSTHVRNVANPTHMREG